MPTPRCLLQGAYSNLPVVRAYYEMPISRAYSEVPIPRSTIPRCLFQGACPKAPGVHTPRVPQVLQVPQAQGQIVPKKEAAELIHTLDYIKSAPRTENLLRTETAPSTETVPGIEEPTARTLRP